MIKFILIILLCLIIYMNSNKISFTIKDEGVRKKYDSLIKIIGKPTFFETDQDKIMNSATWMSKLVNLMNLVNMEVVIILKY